MTKKFPFAIVVIAILFLNNLPLAFAAEKKSLKSVLLRAGCKVIKRTISNPTKWEKEEFNLQVKQSVLADLLPRCVNCGYERK